MFELRHRLLRTDGRAWEFLIGRPKIWDFRFVSDTQSSSFKCTFGYFLLFLGQANLEWNLKATSILQVAENSFQSFPRLSIFGYRSSPVAATIMVPRKLLNHWLTCWYNCGATICYHSIGMTCWNDPLFHTYLLITHKRAGWPKIWCYFWPRIQNHLKFRFKVALNTII